MTSRKLRTGFSTGTAATAATQAAVEAILRGQTVPTVSVDLPQGGQLLVAVKEVGRSSTSPEAWATVIKDAGDDPDVTHLAAITAQVRFLSDSGPESIEILGGEGVGLVTRPGLPVPIGQPAVNPTPRRMIEEGIHRIWRKSASQDGPCRAEVTISVEDGGRLAKRTLNPRLGIIGGISILGTSGLVKPFSHEAYTATIESALNVAKALGLTEVVLTTGGKSERRAMALMPDLAETAFIQIADYFGFALDEIRNRSFSRVNLVSFFGKAVKQAQGLVVTHAHKAPLDLARLASWLTEAGAPALLVEAVAQANTAREALEIIKAAEAIELVAAVGHRILSSARTFLGRGPIIRAIIIDHNGTVLFAGEDG